MEERQKGRGREQRNDTDETGCTSSSTSLSPVHRMQTGQVKSTVISGTTLNI